MESLKDKNSDYNNQKKYLDAANPVKEKWLIQCWELIT
jgi:hypothetical protein